MFDHADNTSPLTATTEAREPAGPENDLKSALAQAFLAAPPSERIHLAVADLEAAERSSAYSIDMDTWHAPDRRSGACAVCMAGAVLANRHSIRPHQIYVGPFPAESPEEFSTTAEWDRVLTGLDDLRDGYVDVFLLEDSRIAAADIESFVARFGPDNPGDPFPGHVAYEDDPAAFKMWASTVADQLAAHGL